MCSKTHPAVQTNITPLFFKGIKNGSMDRTRTSLKSISCVNQIKTIIDITVADLGAIELKGGNLSVQTHSNVQH